MLIIPQFDILGQQNLVNTKGSYCPTHISSLGSYLSKIAEK